MHCVGSSNVVEVGRGWLSSARGSGGAIVIEEEMWRGSCRRRGVLVQQRSSARSSDDEEPVVEGRQGLLDVLLALMKARSVDGGFIGEEKREERVDDALGF